MVTFNIKTSHNTRELYKIGDRIAQLVIIPVPLAKYVEVEELSETQRGTDGHGSTGN
jgi:dUTP pyrophosphatase